MSRKQHGGITVNGNVDITVNGNINTETLIANVKHDDTYLKPKTKADTMCAPGLKFEAGSCIELPVLNECAKAYNAEPSNGNKIKLPKNLEILNPQKYKQYLVTELSKRMSDVCTSQHCWTMQSFIQNMNNALKKQLLESTFRPESPSGKFTWLNTLNINDVMKQYENNKYTDFYFFGAVPMDFADLPSLEISKPDYDDLLKKGKSKLGVVFNLDNHNQPGSHWVAMYTNLKTGEIYYFDSVGVKPEPRVRTLMRKQARFIMEKFNMTQDNLSVKVNKVQHQKENTECGVYSINFILRMLRGDDFDTMTNKPVSDSRINKCRNKYFRKQFGKN